MRHALVHRLASFDVAFQEAGLANAEEIAYRFHAQVRELEGIYARAAGLRRGWEPEMLVEGSDMRENLQTYPLHCRLEGFSHSLKLIILHRDNPSYVFLCA